MSGDQLDLDGIEAYATIITDMQAINDRLVAEVHRLRSGLATAHGEIHNLRWSLDQERARVEALTPEVSS